MSNGHDQIDKLIMNNTLKDFLVEAVQDETFTAGRVSDPLTRLQNNQWKVSKTYSPSNLQGMTSRQHLQAPRPQNPLAHLKRNPSMNIDRFLKSWKQVPGSKATPSPRVGMPGAGALGAVAFLAPAIQELLYHSMGLDPYGLEDETWFNPEGSTYETAFPPGPSRIEPIKPK